MDLEFKIGSGNVVYNDTDTKVEVKPMENSTLKFVISSTGEYREITLEVTKTGKGSFRGREQIGKELHIDDFLYTPYNNNLDKIEKTGGSKTIYWNSYRIHVPELYIDVDIFIKVGDGLYIKIGHIDSFPRRIYYRSINWFLNMVI